MKIPSQDILLVFLLLLFGIVWLVAGCLSGNPIIAFLCGLPAGAFFYHALRIYREER